MSAPTAAALRDSEGPAVWLGALARRFPDLLAELTPSTSRPLRERPGANRVGGTAAPVRLYVSDAIRDITDGVVELEEAVRDRLGLRRVPAASVPVRLRRVAGLLDRVADHPDLAAHIADEARRMTYRCTRALGDPEQLLRVAGRCPACDSVSLRAFPERAVVMCVNPVCRHVLEGAEAVAG
ncbi:hypothetical protein [Streptomyces spectabilis]|uniref:Uncharacterized protein n=1 Tax=Streptomyces spectabilis TaxID=68270 RepID=A0A5P2XCQ7_STRST|nr:hypothetical protein [Streptomyces spectabilis]MBB5108136.1 hypothetical protein [Streptomyces spectabilis]MCI3904358.1 hypothetical protein [Streptomyces spectabilis]QEV61464.1 hypothetical protein CP982_24445 [Streptomyces spectabilis]GGV26741.1 hypothetical protein GCM10010245_43910 [Streptomyces spectabilis]